MEAMSGVKAHDMPADRQDDVIVNVQRLVLPYVARLTKTRLAPE
jgi:hypothetical protein